MQRRLVRDLVQELNVVKHCAALDASKHFIVRVHAKRLTGLRTAKTVTILLRRKLRLQLRELCLSPNPNVIAKNARRNAFEQKDVIVCNRYSILNSVSLLSDIIVEYPREAKVVIESRLSDNEYNYSSYYRRDKTDETLRSLA